MNEQCWKEGNGERGGLVSKEEKLSLRILFSLSPVTVALDKRLLKCL